ncbi:MAG: ATP-binding protein, partial [Myxococcota bacterium]
FDPFFSHTHGGIGLGLSTCLLIVTRAGGRIEVESAVGQGSSFRIVLPSVRLP